MEKEINIYKIWIYKNADWHLDPVKFSVLKFSVLVTDCNEDFTTFCKHIKLGLKLFQHEASPVSPCDKDIASAGYSFSKVRNFAFATKHYIN